MNTIQTRFVQLRVLIHCTHRAFFNKALAEDAGTDEALAYMMGNEL